jgi:hypothetical protein
MRLIGPVRFLKMHGAKSQNSAAALRNFPSSPTMVTSGYMAQVSQVVSFWHL